MDNTQNQLPEVIVLIGVFVFFVNNYFGTAITTENVVEFIDATTKISIMLSAVWSFFHSKMLVRENSIMSAKMNVLIGQLKVANAAQISKSKPGVPSKSKK